MSESPSPPRPPGVHLSTTALVFAGTTLVLGVVIGWLAGAGKAPPPSAAPEPPPAAAEAPPTKKGPPPADSPFLASSILDSFADPALKERYTRSVSFLAQGDGKGALRGLVQLEDASVDQPWREAAMTLVILGRASAGEVGAPRHLIAGFRQEFPQPTWPGTLALAEAKTWATQAARVRNERGGKSVDEQRAEATARAIELLDQAIAADPDGASGVEAATLKAELGG
jgi:pyruvate/2-oxoglutarate dehydrogenase complex dihydrolipoamide acyltransferase (E2) component